LVLLVGAGLMVRSFSKLLQVNPGFEPGNLVAAQVFLPTTKYRERHRLVQFFEEVVGRVRSTPSVMAASAVSVLAE
jgi:putative ABC transport system permease protein